MARDTEHDTELSDPEPQASVSDLPEGDRDADHRGHWLVENWRYLRQWLARGRTGSAYWVPQVGDRVRLHGRGTWLVYAVWIRRGEVQLGGPSIQRLADVEPVRREDLDTLYGTPDWERASSRKDVLTLQVPAPQDADTEEESPQLRAVPNLDEEAGDGQETEIS